MKFIETSPFFQTFREAFAMEGLCVKCSSNNIFLVSTPFSPKKSFSITEEEEDFPRVPQKSARATSLHVLMKEIRHRHIDHESRRLKGLSMAVIACKKRKEMMGVSMPVTSTICPDYCSYGTSSTRSFGDPGESNAGRHLCRIHLCIDVTNIVSLCLAISNAEHVASYWFGLYWLDIKDTGVMKAGEIARAVLDTWRFQLPRH